ncbi:hypothetical protein R3X28_00260 [Maribacter sp. TH_r10]|uniref:hypothetical protein n=1 Tax=Maribacter sp. TH_r10 TaxID=3082086 RepID=UPI002954000A|nr:hypothetical protein [Maribacter sp. TH_r10]MDV7137282.1 hypothetical protein [Maribacter sp. TH_r10]
MPLILKNKNLELQLDYPNEGYNSARFDWSGKITKVKFKSRSITGLERTDYKNDGFLGKGFYNEFGIDSALGFTDTEIGGWFHKIGVGLLKKKSNQYLFHEKYEIKPAKFKITKSPYVLTFNCISELVNGYAYTLKKVVTLNESGFTIDYTLTNTGSKDIYTDEYVHNFMALDKALMGKGYVLNFPFALQPEKFGETLNPEQKVVIGTKGFGFNGTPNEQFFFSNLSGGEDVNATWELHHQESRIGICETGNFKTDKINLWGWRHVISPELFFSISIRSGESAKWSRTYKVYDLD